jgi:hypothetical protein
MPGYEVKMGFGLHVGWSIEGAIGSNFKIDASYLSPNVNMSARLEGATKQYGVPLLITGHLHDVLTERTQYYSRLVDAVTMKGGTEIYKLYTIDIDPTGIATEKGEGHKSKMQQKIQRVKNRINRDKFRDSALEGSLQVSSLFETDEDLVHMRKGYSHVIFCCYYLARNSSLTSRRPSVTTRKGIGN